MKNCRSSRIFSVYIVILFFSFTLFGQPPSWYSKIKQIRLLETTRADAERILLPVEVVSEFKGEVGVRVEYRLPGASISVIYSNGYCEPGNEYGYNVERGTAIGLEAALKRPMEFSRFDFDIAAFQKKEIGDVVGMFTYTRESDGQELYGSSTRLSQIILSPAEKQKNLACENIVQQTNSTRLP
jgi:hypothetical protein